MVNSVTHFGSISLVASTNTIKMTDIDLIAYIGYSMGYGIGMGILWSVLLFYWRHETM